VPNNKTNALVKTMHKCIGNTQVVRISSQNIGTT